MHFDNDLTTSAVLAELGARLARQRLERDLTQDELATEAGVGRATLQRLESGQSVQLTSLVRLLRVLGLLDGLDAVVPEPVPSPIERLKMQGRRRQRATGRRDEPAPEGTWTWGDDQPVSGAQRKRDDDYEGAR